MRFLLLSLAVGMYCCSLAGAEEGPRRSPQGGESNAVVVLEALIAEIRAADLPADRLEDAGVIARIRELEKQGKLERQATLRLTTIDGQKGLLQFGERVATVTGRAAIRGGGDSPTSWGYQNVGTLLSVVPNVQGEYVVLECSFEQSRVSPPKPVADKADPNFEPSTIESITSQSSVRLKSGETTILASRRSGTESKTAITYVLLTARIQAAQDDAPPRVVKIIPLAHAKASVAMKTVQLLTEDRAVRLAVDERINAIIVSGSEAELAIIEHLVQRLDEPGEK